MGQVTCLWGSNTLCVVLLQVWSVMIYQCQETQTLLFKPLKNCMELAEKFRSHTLHLAQPSLATAQSVGVSTCLPQTVTLQLILRKLVSADSSSKSLIYSLLLTFNIYESHCIDSYSMFICCREECFKTQPSAVGLYHSIGCSESIGFFTFCVHCFLQRFFQISGPWSSHDYWDKPIIAI